MPTTARREATDHFLNPSNEPGLKGKIVIVRSVKPYVDAHNHLAVGLVLEDNERYLRLLCRTFHYRKTDRNQRNSIQEGGVAVRIIPWVRIEVIHEMDKATEWKSPAKFSDKGDYSLKTSRGDVRIIRGESREEN
ncbi:MAG: hypothetical protein AB7F75_13120 [Planctomycetota bacterium]